jgi:formate dehydrogenase major subunit
VRTRNPELEALRRTTLELLARGYPADDSSGVDALHRYFERYGVAPSGARRVAPDVVHPHIRVDMSRCIHCLRCVRICRDLQGQDVWHVVGRGDEAHVVPDGPTLRDSSCVSCGACVDTCPSGALEDQSMYDGGEPDTWTRSTCPYCGTGCETNVGTRNGRVVTVRPALDSPVSKGHLCVKGRYAFDFIRSGDRLEHPMIRRDGNWTRASWEEAIQFVADAFRRVLDRHGPAGVGMLGSARATNEDNYVAQKFARVVLRTNNVDCCARVCHAPTAVALSDVLGTGAATNSFDDIELSSCFLVCGANPTENHPIVGARIRQQARRGAKLIVIDPRRTELADEADIHLRVRPGRNIPLLHAMAHTIIDEGLADRSFIEDRVENLPSFRTFIAGFTPEAAALECAVSPDEIRAAARLYAASSPAMTFHGLGVTEHGQGTDGVRCLANLALLTGNIGKRGAGLNPLRGQNNVQGAAHMGCEPSRVTGYAKIASARDVIEPVWGTALSLTPGLNLLQMMDAARRGVLRALWAVGYDILFTNANANETEKALGSLEFLVVQDLFMNETARRFAHVVLPAASSFEKDGTFMNSERRIQRVRRAVEPAGEARPDWQIQCDVAKAMGRKDGFCFASAEEIWEEIRKVWPLGAGITYARLEERGMQWPCPDESHPGTEVLHVGRFASGKRAALSFVRHQLSPEVLNDDYPLLLVTGRTLNQFNAGTMTLRTKNVELRPDDLLEISPTDAQRFAVEDGAVVTVRSRHGEARLHACVTDRVRSGEVFATFHTTATFLNRVTSPHRDAETDTPEYKLTAVRIEP